MIERYDNKNDHNDDDNAITKQMNYKKIIMGNKRVYFRSTVAQFRLYVLLLAVFVLLLALFVASLAGISSSPRMWTWQT